MTKIFTQNLGDFLIDWVNDLIPDVVSNAGNLFNYSILLVILGIAILWVYSGFWIFNDSLKRFLFSNKFFYFIIFVIGILTGPIGLVIYRIIKPKYSHEELDFIRVEHKFYYHQASKVVDCLYCGAYVLDNHAYCTNCGVQNRFKCQKCGALTDYDDLYCFSCGLSFGKRAEDIVKKIEDRKLRESSKQKKVSDSTIAGNYDRLGLNLKPVIENLKQILHIITEKARDLGTKAYSKASSSIKNTSLSLRKNNKKK